MPQTSPMNWLTLSLMLITFLNIMFSSKMLYETKNLSIPKISVKKMMEWLW